MAISEGDTVSVHYTGRLQSGEIFDSSRERDPLTFTVGAGKVIPGFERGVEGLDVGDERTVEVPPQEGYGERDERLIRKVSKEDLQSPDLQEGMRIGLQAADGVQLEATVMEIDDEGYTLDFNHILAGRTLVFDIEVVSVGATPA